MSLHLNAPGRQLRKLIVGLSVACIALVRIGTPSADATVVTSSGGVASTWFSCNPNLHAINYEVSISPARGLTSQTVAYRTWIYSYATKTGEWTNWTMMTAPPGKHMNFVTLPFSAGTNNYAMYMQYSWWDGRSWSTSGEWITTYTQQTLFGGYYEQSYCRA